jgi:hypothetical protein
MVVNVCEVHYRITEEENISNTADNKTLQCWGIVGEFLSLFNVTLRILYVMWCHTKKVYMYKTFSLEFINLASYCSSGFSSNFLKGDLRYFLKHPLENKHPIDTVENTINMLYSSGKDSHLSTIEKQCFYEETKNNNQLNDQKTWNQVTYLELYSKNNHTQETINVFFSTQQFTSFCTTQTNNFHLHISSQ